MFDVYEKLVLANWASFIFVFTELFICITFVHVKSSQKLASLSVKVALHAWMLYAIA